MLMKSERYSYHFHAMHFPNPTPRYVRASDLTKFHALLLLTIYSSAPLLRPFSLHNILIEPD